MTTQKTWAEAFAPVMAKGRESREGQSMLGQAILDAIENGGTLLAQASTGTGKSFATLIPMIVKIQEHKALKNGKSFRAVVSTETLTLQDQLVEKDLPFLSTLYSGFTYRKLMGRTNYLCLNNADQAVIGDAHMYSLVAKLKARQQSIGDGERKDVERVLGRELDNREWSRIASASDFCADNMCAGDECYSTRARDLAKAADLVVVNHALLATDIEMKIGSQEGPMAEGMLGHFQVLAVDEAHQLEPVLVSQWTKEITERELDSMISNIVAGVATAKSVLSSESAESLVADTSHTLDGLEKVFRNIKKYYMLLEEQNGGEWEGSSSALSLKYPLGFPSAALAAAMTEFEEENPKRLAAAEVILEKALPFLLKGYKEAHENKVKKVKKPLNKGIRSTKDLIEAVKIISKALETKDGIIQQYGTYGALVDGWVKKFDNNAPSMTIRLVPLDVSTRAAAIWDGPKTNIMLSATLTDLTDGSFRYARKCVGFPDGPELNVDTPFSLHTQQLVYVTPANRPQVEGARYSFDELLDLITASRGRALVLFTSRKELDWAAEELTKYKHLGKFPYAIHVQERECNKVKLMDAFKKDTSSVLLATKSFFVGIDVPGESLSLVALVKFPLPRYSAECRQQIQHWKTRGFPKWYEREALTIFQQASGRLIRSSGCRGVVALLDQRANDGTNTVFKTAKLGVDSLGSPVTQDLNSVQAFLS